MLELHCAIVFKQTWGNISYNGPKQSLSLFHFSLYKILGNRISMKIPERNFFLFLLIFINIVKCIKHTMNDWYTNLSTSLTSSIIKCMTVCILFNWMFCYITCIPMNNNNLQCICTLYSTANNVSLTKCSTIVRNIMERYYSL